MKWLNRRGSTWYSRQLCDTSPISVAVVTSVHNDVGFAIISNLLKLMALVSFQAFIACWVIAAFRQIDIDSGCWNLSFRRLFAWVNLGLNFFRSFLCLLVTFLIVLVAAWAGWTCSTTGAPMPPSSIVKTKILFKKLNQLNRFIDTSAFYLIFCII